MVKEGSGDQCSIVTGAFGENPAGMVGTSPYATRQYAEVALKNFPQCTGGEAEQPAKPEPKITVGAGLSPEQQIIARMYSQALRKARRLR